MSTIATLIAKLGLDTSDFDKGADSASKKASGLGGVLKTAMGVAGGVLGASAISKGMSELGSALGLASDLSESMSKVDVVFGDSASSIHDFASTAYKDLGVSKVQAESAAGSFGNLFVTMGLGQSDAAGMSKGILTLGSDLASFNNLDPTEALDKLRAGLVGEAEPLRALGINLNAAMVEAKAMEMGLVDSSGAVTEAGKVQARYALIMEQTTTAQGDFARTSSGHANQLRILKARWTDIKTEIGSALLPILVTLGGILLNRVMPVVADLATKAIALGKALATAATPVVIQAFESIKAAFFQVRDAVTPIVTKLQELAAWFASNPDAMGAAAAGLAAILVAAFVSWAIAAGAAAVATIAAAAPVLALMAAIGALGAAIFLLVKHWEELREKYPLLDAAAEKTQEVFTAFADWITGTFVPAVQVITDKVIEVVDAVVGYVSDHWDEIRAVIEPVMKAIATLVEYQLKTVQNFFETAFGVIRGLFDVFAGLFTGDWDRMKEGLIRIATSLKDGVVQQISLMIDLIRGLAGIAFDAMKAVGDKLMDGLRSALGNVAGFAGDVGDAVLQAVKGVINNYVIGPINRALEFSFDTHIPGVGKITINPPDLPYLATGGVVTRATLAVLGEAGPEAVLPLDVLGKLVQPSSDALSRPRTPANGGAGATGATFNFNGPMTIHGASRGEAERVFRDVTYPAAVVLRARGVA